MQLQPHDNSELGFGQTGFGMANTCTAPVRVAELSPTPVYNVSGKETIPSPEGLMW